MKSGSIRSHPSANRLSHSKTLFIQRHDTIPGLNLHSEKLDKLTDSACSLNGFYEPFGLKSGYPLPLLPPNDIRYPQTINLVDPVTKVIIEKHLWSRKINYTMFHCKTSLKKEGVYKDLVDQFPLSRNKSIKGVLGLGMMKYALQLQDDPDPYMKNSNYNFHYGSTLSAFKSKGSYLVISPAGPALDELHLKVVDPKNSFKTDTYTFSNQMKKGSAILEVSSLRKKKFMCVRQRNSVAYLRYNKSEHTLKTLLCIESKTPFGGMDASYFSESEICLIKLDKKFQIWDVEQSTTNPKVTGRLPCDEYFPDSWCNVRFGRQENELMAVDRYNVYLYDTRTDLKSHVNKWSPWDQGEVCEEISLLHSSSVNPAYWYIGTSHNIFSLDTRSTFKQRWTHLLTAPPSMATCHSIEDKELLLFGCQLLPNIECIVNDWSLLDCPVSRFSPKLLPSTLDTYHEAKLSNACNNPIVSCRFDSTTVGLSTVKQKNGGLTLFTNKASGDIFYQHLKPHEHLDDSIPSFTEEDINVLNSFEKKCWKKYKKEAMVVKVTADPPKSTKKFLTCMKAQEAKGKMKTSPVKLYEPNWGMKRDYMESCKDILASKISKIWEVERTPDWSADVKSDSDESVTDFEDEGGQRIHNMDISVWSEKLGVESPENDSVIQSKRTHNLRQIPAKSCRETSPDIFDDTTYILPKLFSQENYLSSTTSEYIGQLISAQNGVEANIGEDKKSVDATMVGEFSNREDNVTVETKAGKSNQLKTSETNAIKSKKSKTKKSRKKKYEEVLEGLNPFKNFPYSQQVTSKSEKTKKKKKHRDTEKSQSLLEFLDINLIQKSNSPVGGRSSSGSAQSFRPPQESPVKIFFKEEKDSSFIDEDVNTNFLIPMATSTQAAPMSSPAMKSFGFSEHTSFLGSQNLTAVTNIDERTKPNSHLRNVSLNSTYTIDPCEPSSQSARKRPIASPNNSPRKSSRFSLSSMPGF